MVGHAHVTNESWRKCKKRNMIITSGETNRSFSKKPKGVNMGTQATLGGLITRRPRSRYDCAQLLDVISEYVNESGGRFLEELVFKGTY